ncbi:hypothetical protein [Maribacter sp. 2307ULW6-5]|uniref:hypothetical protein n=1 Tax=Maribacter sp. 2307ULW6-5 TaxID=3386275 RepID=UPI0039BC3528
MECCLPPFGPQTLGQKGTFHGDDLVGRAFAALGYPLPVGKERTFYTIGPWGSFHFLERASQDKGTPAC